MLAALAEPTLFGALAAQTAPPHRAAATAMYHALSNTIATEASGFARTGVFPAGIWQEWPHPLVQVVILDATRAGWSAIALYRDDPDVECAVSVGAAATLLNSVQAGDRPYCMAADGSPVSPDPAPPDASWLFWWQDEALDVGPRVIACPSLKVPKLPKTNDSVYVEFVIGTDGHVQPSQIAVESTGNLDESVAMLMRLAGCRFEPGRMRNTPVRTLMRQQVGLAPDRPLRKHTPVDAAPWVSPDPYEATQLRAMQDALRAAATAQEEFRATTGIYASHVRDLDLSALSSPDVRVAILSSSATAWSAVAVHDSTAAHCFIGVGDTIPIPVIGPRGKDPFCVASNGLPLTASSPNGDFADQPPSLRGCSRHLQLQPEGDTLRNARVILEYVVGADGRPEPRTVRVLLSTGLVAAAGAIQFVSHCRYHPGTSNGKPIRVLVRQPVNF